MGARRKRNDAPVSQPTMRETPPVDERLRYVADMAGELAALAGAIRQPMLTYFLNMARVEAEMRINDLASDEKKNEVLRNTSM